MLHILKLPQIVFPKKNGYGVIHVSPLNIPVFSLEKHCDIRFAEERECLVRSPLFMAFGVLNLVRELFIIPCRPPFTGLRR